MGCLKIKLSICRKVLKVVKMDGKVMEFKAPVMVRELLVNYEGFGVKSSRKSSEELPPSYELQLGRIYYLLPREFRAPAAADGGATAAVKRIKVVITKKQLEELLSKKTSMEKIIFGIDKACSNDLATNWKPNLAPIPEEIEL